MKDSNRTRRTVVVVLTLSVSLLVLSVLMFVTGTILDSVARGRAETKRMMKAISALVDHERNYIPIEVPLPPLEPVEKLGVLLPAGSFWPARRTSTWFVR